MNNRSVLFRVVITLLLLNLGLSSQSDTQAKEILENMIGALGGREVLENIKDSTTKGVIEMAQQGVGGTVIIYTKKPDKMRMDLGIMGMTFTQAFDGQTAWDKDPQTGDIKEMPEQAAQYFQRDALGDESFLHPEEHGITYTYQGKETIETRTYHVLEQKYEDGYKTTLYIDAKTFLLYKIKAIAPNLLGVDAEIETISSEYKKINGTMVAFRMTQYHDGKEALLIMINEVQLNTGLSDYFFAMEK